LAGAENPGVFAVTAVIGLFAFPWGGKLLKQVKEKELDFSAMLIAALAFAVLAEALDLHFILGPFVAGVFFGRRTIDESTYDSVRSKVSGMTFGFLTPIFFASIGLHMDLGAFTEIPDFLALLVAAAFFGKVLGSATAAYWFGLGRIDAIAVGVGMSARGAVELVIANIALRAGVFVIPGVESPPLAPCTASLSTTGNLDPALPSGPNSGARVCPLNSRAFIGSKSAAAG
jgi:Kef-type K+ transport system membrane component KefB